MRRLVFFAGRLTQAAALLILPSAIWTAEIRHSERESIGIFVFSIVLFTAGFLCTRLVSK
jgi:hypothetical protein